MEKLEEKTEEFVGKTKAINKDLENKNIEAIKKYTLFGEQYLEKQVHTGKQSMKFSATVCTYRGVPLFDDF
ncbi:hypothetical protein KAJ87_01140 [Candidatus Pacearchaeota archaeon]|nr:hypothetical protein [Candidatus Pacearchaeota archaeon]